MKRFSHCLTSSRLVSWTGPTPSWTVFNKLPEALFEIPVEPVTITCPLRVESRLYYRVERVFHSLDSFLLALPRFLLRPIVLRK